MVTCVDIPTGTWNKITGLLKKRGWRLTYKYDGVDAGIDYDLVIFEKDGCKILLGWDNWLEGEIQCEEIHLKEIEGELNESFKRGNPVNLKPDVLDIVTGKIKSGYRKPMDDSQAGPGSTDSDS